MTRCGMSARGVGVAAARCRGGAVRGQTRSMQMWGAPTSRRQAEKAWPEKVRNRLREDITKGVHERRRCVSPALDGWPWSDEQTAEYVRQVVAKEGPRAASDGARLPARAFLEDTIADLRAMRAKGCDAGAATFTVLFDYAVTQDVAAMGVVWEAMLRDRVPLRLKNWQQILAFHGRQRDAAAVRWTYETYLRTGALAPPLEAAYIRALVACGEKAEAMGHFRTIKAATPAMYTAALLACDSYDAGAAFIEEMETRGIVVDIAVFAVFLRMLARLPDAEATERVFAQVSEAVAPSQACWDSLMEVYRNTIDLQGALGVLRRMQAADAVTARGLISLVELCTTLQTSERPIPSLRRVVDMCEKLGNDKRYAVVGTEDTRYDFLSKVIARYYKYLRRAEDAAAAAAARKPAPSTEPFGPHSRRGGPAAA